MIIECTQCRAYVEAEEHRDFHYPWNKNRRSGRFVLLSCSKCDSPILVQQENVGNQVVGDVWDTPNLIFPNTDQQANLNAPREIRAALNEASSCVRARAYTAAAIMCRKTLEGVCAAHSINERNLMESLRKMRDTGLIDRRLFDWSDALRLAGNEAAHGVTTIIPEEDAKDILELTHAIIDYMFSFRDRFEQFKKRRAGTLNPQ